MDKITRTGMRDISEIASAPKSDLHNHAGRGGSIAYLSKFYGVKIYPPQRRFIDLSDMQNWFDENIKTICVGLEGYLKRLEAAFVQADDDHVAVLALSFAKDEVDALDGMVPFMSTISRLHATFAPRTLFLPELALGREQKEHEIRAWLEEILEYGYFKSIDICNNEFAQPIRKFVNVYRIAERYKLRLTAHVGEFGSADDVMEAVETLHLQEVHHGIAAADSEQIMNWLAAHKIQLNICPTSNILLSRAEDYGSHPIKTLFRYGVPVTINTDDMLIFNSGVSEEYKKLFGAGAFTCAELDQIRNQGLSWPYRARGSNP